MTGTAGVGTIVGFSLDRNLPRERKAASQAAQGRALDQFRHLERVAIPVGPTTVDVWGHQPVADRVHRCADGSLLVLAGSPVGKVNWGTVVESLSRASAPSQFELPWDGRAVLVWVSADGLQWRMWNDFVGSIPVFHAGIDGGVLASTVEPVVVAGGAYSAEHVFLPGLVSLLINGHYLSDWTLFDGMRVVPADSIAEWDDTAFRWQRLWTVRPGEGRWEAQWDDLVDEMHELARKAIADALHTQSSWLVPLSSGLDSRLIACVAAELGTDFRTYAWGGRHTTDVVYSQQIARLLGVPWRRIDLRRDFLAHYTPRWADWFGSAMHFHGMYQMAFLDNLASEPGGRLVTGFVGDTLSGDGMGERLSVHSNGSSHQLEDHWHAHWMADEVRASLRVPVADALAANAAELRHQLESLPGARFQRVQFMDLWERQHTMTYFQSVLSDYWRGVAAPFVSRDYARFSLSLPRIALDGRRLLMDVHRRYYPRVAAIPGTYANEPLLRTGRYLAKEWISKRLPPALRRGPFRGFRDVQLRMDMHSAEATGRGALWPLDASRSRLAEWMDANGLDADIAAILSGDDDIRPLRKVQSVQALAYRLLDSQRPTAL